MNFVRRNSRIVASDHLESAKLLKVKNVLDAVSNKSDSTPVLQDLLVLDLSRDVAGQFCAKLLSSFGASCVLIESSEGSPTRYEGLTLDSTDPSRRSTLFRHLNQGKSSVIADVSTQEGQGRIRLLAKFADVIVRDSDTCLDFELPPRVVDCAVSDFPDSGPYRNWKGTEMVHQALSGTMYMTGDADRQPLYGLGRRAYFACGTTACIGVLAALHERASSGLGQRVRASVFESAAAIGQNLVSQYSYSGTFETRVRYPGFLAMLKCSDHWIVIFAIRHFEELCRVFNLAYLLDDDRLGTQAGRLEHWPEITDRLREEAASRRAAELVDALQRARISAEIVAPLTELPTSPQWIARKLLRSVETEDGLAEKALGPPFTVGSSRYMGVGPSPTLPTEVESEARTREIACNWAIGTDSMSKDGVSANRSKGPIEGLRVLDLTTAWSGPFAARSLAFLGAEVIKIDAPSHMDSWRGAVEGGRRDWYPDKETGDRPWNRCVLFNTQGQGKLSFGLDLKVEGALDAFLRLAAESDVLISNFTPNVLERLGIGYETLRQVNPRIIVVEMPAFGPGGPDSRHQGMGKTMEAAAGMAAHMGYGEGVPALTGPAYLDPIGGLSAVAATMMALHRRDALGEGCRVEVPQTEASLHWIGDIVLHQADADFTLTPFGNAVDYAAPHDAFRTKGEDEWIVIAVQNSEQWFTLCDLMGRSDLRHSVQYLDVDSRNRHWLEIYEAISTWTAHFDKNELATTLQIVGIPAAPVLNGSEVATNEALASSGFIKQLAHPEAGVRDYPTLSYFFDRTPGGVERAAPCFGEHNETILRDLLSFSDEQIDKLIKSGAVAVGPVGTET